MLSSLKKLLADLTGSAAPSRFAENDYRVAAAALLVHAVAVDGSITAPERAKLESLITAQFDLDPVAAEGLIREATAAEQEAVDLYSFTSLINRACDDEERRRMVAMLWEVVMADGRVGEFEDNLLWRIADLLNVSSRERIELRRRVAAEQRDGTGADEGSADRGE